MAIIRPPRRTPPIFARPSLQSTPVSAASKGKDARELDGNVGNAAKTVKYKKDKPRNPLKGSENKPIKGEDFPGQGISKSTNVAAARAAARRRLIIGDVPAYEFWDQVVLQVDFEGVDGATTATDASNSAHALTFAGSAQIDTAFKAMGTSSYLGAVATGDVISIPDSDDFTFLGDFTIEAWIRPTVVTNDHIIVCQYELGGGNYGWQFRVTSDELRLGLSDTGTDDLYFHQTNQNLIAVDTWQHVAVVRDGAESRMYHNGVQMGTPKTGFADAAFNANSDIRIAGAWSNTDPLWEFDGHIDGVRIHNGVAIYNEDFTAPTTYPTG